MFIEEGEVAYTYINGKKVPVVKCETEVVLRNKETNYEYGSDQEAEDDIANPDERDIDDDKNDDDGKMVRTNPETNQKEYFVP